MSRFAVLVVFGTLAFALQSSTSFSQDKPGPSKQKPGNSNHGHSDHSDHHHGHHDQHDHHGHQNGHHNDHHNSDHQHWPLKSQGIRLEDLFPNGKPPVTRPNPPPVTRPPVVVRDHRDPVIVRDHRSPPVIVRDHRTPPVIVRDHRTPKPPVVVVPRRPAVVDASQASGGVIVSNSKPTTGVRRPVDASQASGGVIVK